MSYTPCPIPNLFRQTCFYRTCLRPVSDRVFSDLFQTVSQAATSPFPDIQHRNTVKRVKPFCRDQPKRHTTPG